MVYKENGPDYYVRKIEFDGMYENGEPQVIYGSAKTIYEYPVLLNNKGKREEEYGSRGTMPDYSVLMNSYQCDSTIKPTSISYISVEEYNKQQEGKK